jgi:hypothetical protein
MQLMPGPFPTGSDLEIRTKPGVFKGTRFFICELSGLFPNEPFSNAIPSSKSEAKAARNHPTILQRFG